VRRWLRLRSAQIPNLVVLQFLIGFVFWYGIEKIFIAKNLGVGPTGIVAIVTLYTIIILTLDVPASVVADRLGRKRVLLFSILSFVIADIVLGLSNTFFMYLIGTAFWGLFSVSYHGIFEAILFDSLKEQKREKEFQKIDALSRLFYMLGIGVSSISSGFLADIFGLRGAYFASVIPLIVGLILLTSIREPKIHHEDELIDVNKYGYIGHLIGAFRTMWHSPKLRLTMFGVIVMFFIQTPMYEFNQYVYIALFQSPILVGIFGGLSGLVLALGFLIATKRTFKPRFILIIAGISLMLVAFLQNNFSLLFLASALLAGSILENALQTQLQHSTSSRTRASVTSAVYFLGNVLIIPFVFLFGAIAEHQSIWQAFLIDGVIVLVMAFVYFFFTRIKSAKIIPTQ